MKTPSKKLTLILSSSTWTCIFYQDGENIENLAQEFTDLRRDISTRISILEHEFEMSDDVQMSEEEDNSPLPAISIHESIQVFNLWIAFEFFC